MEKEKLNKLKIKIDKYIEKYFIEEELCICKSATASIAEFETAPTFQETLLKFIDTRGLDDVTVYKKADIDRKLFSKIRSNVDYSPKKATVIKLVFGLELNLSDANTLLESAGYSLSRSIMKDVIVMYFIEHKMYNIDDLYQVLYEYGLEL